MKTETAAPSVICHTCNGKGHIALTAKQRVLLKMLRVVGETTSVDLCSGIFRDMSVEAMIGRLNWLHAHGLVQRRRLNKRHFAYKAV